MLGAENKTMNKHTAALGEKVVRSSEIPFQMVIDTNVEVRGKR